MATNNEVNTSLSGQTGTGTFVGSTSPTLVTPILGAASATSITFSSTSGIIGTTTNNNAAAGSVGEFVSSVISSGSPVVFTSTNITDLTSISLTAGDWNVFGKLSGAATTITFVRCWVSTTSAAAPDISLYNSLNQATGNGVGISAPFFRLSIAGTTTVYISGSITGTGTINGSGFISARRIR